MTKEEVDSYYGYKIIIEYNPTISPTAINKVAGTITEMYEDHCIFRGIGLTTIPLKYESIINIKRIRNEPSDFLT